jgi:phosphoenolpyruvate phosphomutase
MRAAFINHIFNHEAVAVICAARDNGAQGRAFGHWPHPLSQRTEALIAGLGQDEALKRARAYEAAGADMILIHSKQKTPDEVESFVRAWKGKAPIVIVPTAYPEMTAERIRALGKIKMVIYGNHAVRAAVTAMKQVFAAILQDGGIQNVNKNIVSVEEIFRLQGMDRVKVDEKRFLR